MTKEKLIGATAIIVQDYSLYSVYLERTVDVDVYLPSNFLQPSLFHLLLINDGQDLLTMNFAAILQIFFSENDSQPLFCVGIRCGEERKREYGIAFSADYENRGDKAGLYAKFIFDELIPFIRKQYNAPSFKEKAFAGFSLGGLSALDIVWNHPTEFSKVGVFSGSLWWRRKSYETGYHDETDRLMHLQVLKGGFYPWLQFFFECGELDEAADRNNNGIIDSIDDTLDLIVELKAKGYTDAHIKYIQLKEGKHNIETWAKALLEFLKWGWGNDKN
jgi:esterase/lipase superfamily enzyme